MADTRSTHKRAELAQRRRTEEAEDREQMIRQLLAWQDRQDAVDRWS